MVSLLTPVNPEEFSVLYCMLEQISVPIRDGENSRGKFGRHRAMTLGLTTGRLTGITGLSYYSKKYPHIYEEILRIRSLIGGTYTSIHVNKNVICPRHYDPKNVGDSVLVSFGDYTGCNIVIEEDCIPTTYDAFSQPILFNGSTLRHWNTDDLTGTKYSLVFYNH
mgnify:CR=1 FL=1|tara:strand:- start:261 stop:755 length:495 start_codon:yes stop_codon:yes gene_type:complete